ncbi:MAG: hypothetical protein NTX38_08540 [Methylobacter sp.]|nr:hypothetical protein [Methylobacter sp.]
MINAKVEVIVRGFVFSVMTLLISGCSVPFFGGYGANHQSLEDFKSHVEEIFRLQNQMSSEVIMLVESGEENKHDALKLAEQKMQKTCADLNEYASRDIDGLSISFSLHRRVEKSAIDCENAALAIKPLLK